VCRVDCLGFHSIIDQLTKLENVDWNTPNAADYVTEVAPNFVSFFEPLMSLMAVQERKLAKKKEKAEKKAFQATSVTFSTVSRPVTPDQPIEPQDSNYSGSSTVSQDEESTKELVKQFIVSATRVLGGEFTTIRWQQSGKSVMLVSSYSSSH
jgi:hypothetical protein